MEWSKLKTVIIVILLIVNAVLLFLLVRDTQTTRRLRADALDDLHTVLRINGIELKAETLPDSDGVYALTSARDVAEENEISTTLLGFCIFDDKGGNIHYYHSELGEAYFRGTGDFEMTLYSADESAFKLMRKLFSEKGIVLPAEIYGSANQTLGNLPVYDCVLTFEKYESGVKITGRLITSPAVPDINKPAIDAPTALVRFVSEMNLNGFICTEVTNIELGYSMAAPVAGDFELTPVWRIITDTGEYYINGVNGALIK
ncbi:MAG: hypothetical protein ACOX7P_04750 [Oscillospiraceae bacterium]|jgi:hypothetical protein